MDSHRMACLTKQTANPATTRTTWEVRVRHAGFVPSTSRCVTKRAASSLRHSPWQVRCRRQTGRECSLQEQPASRLFNPLQPGETLKAEVLSALGLSVTDAAQQLGVTRTALPHVLDGHAAIWSGKQIDCDLWITRQRPAPKVERPPEPAGA
jgi:antitoxin HigA-1